MQAIPIFLLRAVIDPHRSASIHLLRPSLSFPPNESTNPAMMRGFQAMRRAASAAHRTQTRSASSLGPSLAEQEEVFDHAKKTLGTYRNISLFVAIPACLLIGFKSFVLAEHEHAPEFVEYDHLRKRAKKFPWGDGNHSLFHNAHMNALPDGYEAEHH
ncbi:cytochrome c oxidase polypeptide VIa [Salpingoeca rosetta]|uniref:Cytochrome c oxidase polypeptide VIa n=1 Tax=Salpingoeca rosetta (strain ATCC 50818 / BSB-021) TaxID=946362 RepID=F2TZH3_SALR5|nr:cytochrome c oxidase polypeptide VIa [Salpingoeca rosetta]EGD78997.1 cytochrome c oxidase polypeptide VIa [Salpingoeca rosetta]|eukprot:XP_004997953.1 cytochrome c oxidase polypeptide VIa [Salpingoeca rosetta]